MNKTKYFIGIALLFLVVGLAAVTTNLVINGIININQNPDDFLVYFSDVKVDGTRFITSKK